MTTPMEAVRALAGEVWKPEGVEIWLNHPNAHLNYERPVDLVERGEWKQVVNLIVQAADGVFV